MAEEIWQGPVTVFYLEPDGTTLRFNGESLEHCHEQFIDYLGYTWEQKND